jgi:thiamine pyrophosphate-dependent acetolactate synthase large subunit-like protein
MRVRETLAAELAGGGVDTVFGVVGEGNLALATLLHRTPGVRYLAARREDGAVAMADGYARASGRLGVATVTHGPGLTNTVTALTEAVRARTPLLLLAGAVGRSDRTNRQRIDQARLAQATGAEVVEVTSPAHAAADLRHAMTRAVSSRVPVLLNLPVDVQQAEAEPATGPPWRPPARPRPAPEPAAVRAAARALAAARRPVVLAGRGAVLAGARAELERLADRAGALLCTTLFANGFFAGHPYDVGICGGFATGLGERLIADADCVVAFGASLNRWTTANGRLLTGTVIHCDSDPAAIGRWLRPAHALVADAALGAAALADALAGAPADGLAGVPAAGLAGAPVADPPGGGDRAGGDRGDRGYRSQWLAAEIAGYDVSGEFRDASGPDGLDLHPVSVLLDRRLPVDRQVVVDVGHFMSVPSRYVRVRDPRGYLSPSAFGAIGLSLPAAVGAAAARPDRLTVCFVGDGGLMMGLPELDTARRAGLPLLVVVMNDRAYGAEVHLSRHHGIPDDLAWFDPVDLAATAAGLGLPARSASTLDDLAAAVDELVRAGGPALLDVRLDARVVTAYYRDAVTAGGRHAAAGGHRVPAGGRRLATGGHRGAGDHHG